MRRGRFGRPRKYLNGGKIMIARSILTAAAFAVFMMMIGCQGAPSNASAEAVKNTNAAAAKSEPRVVDDIKELLAKHDKALSEKNVDDVVGTFAADANTVVLGTGQGERFVGKDAIKEAYTQMFKDY